VVGGMSAWLDGAIRPSERPRCCVAICRTPCGMLIFSEDGV